MDIYTFNYAKTLKEALILANRFRTTDPFTEISPTLLNRTHIARYVEKTGMIYPFNPKKLKPASYEVKLGNEILFWDKDGQKIHLEKLTPNNPITLRQNSITYVGVDCTFTLPFYIALRFNLTITHVHRGLLLGTGPLIDPGFCGNIMIPIHNLTTNDYVLRPGEDLIAVEFTKISTETTIDPKEYEKNVKEKDLSFEAYIYKAIAPLQSVESSLEKTLREAKQEVKKASDSVKEITDKSDSLINRTRNISIVALFVAIITFFAISYQIYSVISDANKYVSDSTNVLYQKSSVVSDNKLDEKIVNGISQLETKINNNVEKIQKNMDEKLAGYEKVINDLKREMKELESQVKTDSQKHAPSSKNKQ